ncbi:hypothetical protein DFJ73DRAFT_842148 [Zopfochytrium polystomum]|nr:hypothetical protein DFJ73DRAFT_842148 [Zopfochytrium polystomum]
MRPLPPSLRSWLPQLLEREDEGNDDEMVVEELADGFLLVQILGLLRPDSVDLTWYLTDEATFCDDLRAHNHRILADGLRKARVSGLASVEVAVARAAAGDLDASVAIAEAIYASLGVSGSRGDLDDAFEHDDSEVGRGGAGFETRSLEYGWALTGGSGAGGEDNGGDVDVDGRSMELLSGLVGATDISRFFAESRGPDLNVTDEKAEGVGTDFADVQHDEPDLGYQPAEISFVAEVRWLVLKCMRVCAGSGALSQDLDALYQQSLVKGRHLSHVILSALTSGLLYHLLVRSLEGAELDPEVTSISCNAKNFVPIPGSFLDALIDKQLLSFSSSIKSSIGNMISDPSPFYESIHSNIIEALMQWANADMSLDRVMDYCRQELSYPDSAHPYDLEDGLLAWVNAVNRGLQQRFLPGFIPKRAAAATDLVLDLRDGISLCGLACWYHMEGISPIDVRFSSNSDADLLSWKDRLHNLKLFDEACRKFERVAPPWRPEEFCGCDESGLQNSTEFGKVNGWQTECNAYRPVVLAFLSELFRFLSSPIQTVKIQTLPPDPAESAETTLLSPDSAPSTESSLTSDIQSIPISFVPTNAVVKLDHGSAAVLPLEADPAPQTVSIEPTVPAAAEAAEPAQPDLKAEEASPIITKSDVLQEQLVQGEDLSSFDVPVVATASLQAPSIQSVNDETHSIMEPSNSPKVAPRHEPPKSFQSLAELMMAPRVPLMGTMTGVDMNETGAATNQAKGMIDSPEKTHAVPEDFSVDSPKNQPVSPVLPAHSVFQAEKVLVNEGNKDITIENIEQAESEFPEQLSAGSLKAEEVPIKAGESTEYFVEEVSKQLLSPTSPNPQILLKSRWDVPTQAQREGVLNLISSAASKAPAAMLASPQADHLKSQKPQPTPRKQKKRPKEKGAPSASLGGESKSMAELVPAAALAGGMENAAAKHAESSSLISAPSKRPPTPREDLFILRNTPSPRPPARDRRKKLRDRLRERGSSCRKEPALAPITRPETANCDFVPPPAPFPAVAAILLNAARLTQNKASFEESEPSEPLPRLHLPIHENSPLRSEPAKSTELMRSSLPSALLDDATLPTIVLNRDTIDSRLSGPIRYGASFQPLPPLTNQLGQDGSEWIDDGKVEWDSGRGKKVGRSFGTKVVAKRRRRAWRQRSYFDPPKTVTTVTDGEDEQQQSERAVVDAPALAETTRVLFEPRENKTHTDARASATERKSTDDCFQTGDWASPIEVGRDIGASSAPQQQRTKINQRSRWTMGEHEDDDSDDGEFDPPVFDSSILSDGSDEDFEKVREPQNSKTRRLLNRVRSSHSSSFAVSREGEKRVVRQAEGQHTLTSREAASIPLGSHVPSASASISSQWKGRLPIPSQSQSAATNSTYFYELSDSESSSASEQLRWKDSARRSDPLQQFPHPPRSTIPSSATTYVAAPSQSRTTSLAKAPLLKRLSNRPIILNALKNVCLAGAVNAKLHDEVVKALSLSDAPHCIINFRGQKNHAFKALYAFDPRTPETIRCIYPVASSADAQSEADGVGSPAGPVLRSEEVRAFFKYDSGGRAFRALETRSFSPNVHGMVLSER